MSDAAGVSTITPTEVAAPRASAQSAKPYSNPYLAGVGVGIALLLAFVIAGRGLGASGAFSAVAATGVRAAAPAHGAQNQFYNDYAGSLWNEWLFVELIGVFIGGFASAYFARRLAFRVESGPRITGTTRLLLAFGGGAIMGVGAKLARGCTSGLGLTGGSLLSAGSWLFVLCAFASAYAVAPLLRKAWR